MVTKRKIVAAYQEDLLCDKCGGHMSFTGRSFMTHPPKRVYKCDSCGDMITDTSGIYPRINYVLEGEENENSEGT